MAHATLRRCIRDSLKNDSSHARPFNYFDRPCNLHRASLLVRTAPNAQSKMAASKTRRSHAVIFLHLSTCRNRTLSKSETHRRKLSTARTRRRVAVAGPRVVEVNRGVFALFRKSEATRWTRLDLFLSPSV